MARASARPLVLLLLLGGSAVATAGLLYWATVTEVATPVQAGGRLEEGARAPGAAITVAVRLPHTELFPREPKDPSRVVKALNTLRYRHDQNPGELNGDRLHDMVKSGDVCPVSPERIRLVLSGADVILVADVHDLPYIQRVLEDIIDYTRADSQKRGVVLLEAVPSEQTEEFQLDLEQARLGYGGPLQSFMRRVWPFPIEAYTYTLPRIARHGARVDGLGEILAGDVVLDPGLPDDHRWPRGSDGSVSQEEFCKNQRRMAEVIARAAVSGDGPVSVLIGAMHLVYPPCSLLDLLRRKGVHAVGVVPFLWDLEDALFTAHGTSACSTWYQLQPHLYRCPTIMSKVADGSVTVRMLREYGPACHGGVEGGRAER